MNIYIKEYDYKRIDGKLTSIDIKQNFFYHIFAQICLFIFKMINWRHVYNKTEDGKYYIKEILIIKGFRTCVYDNYFGQRTTGQFCFSWKVWRQWRWSKKQMKHIDKYNSTATPSQYFNNKSTATY